MTETNEPCYVVSRTKLDRLMAFAIAYGSNDGSVTEKPMMKALEACCEIQLPKLLAVVEAGEELARAYRQFHEVTGDETCVYALELWDKAKAEL